MSILEKLQHLSLEPIEIKVPSWGDAVVYITLPTPEILAGNREILESESDDDEEGIGQRAAYFLLYRCMVEQDGSPVFSSIEHVKDALLHAPIDGFSEIVSALTSKAHRDALKVEQAEKNSIRKRRR